MLSHSNSKRLSLCTEGTASWTLPLDHVCKFICICVCFCIYVRTRVCVCQCQTTQEKEVNLRCNENANCVSCVDLRCQSASQCSIAFHPLTKQPTVNHCTKPFPSFITDKSISLIVMFSLYVHSLFLHRFLWTVSSLSAFSAVSLYSIQSEAAFNWCKKKLGTKKQMTTL